VIHALRDTTHVDDKTPGKKQQKKLAWKKTGLPFRRPFHHGSQGCRHASPFERRRYDTPIVAIM
jgi:hypothetical protein